MGRLASDLAAMGYERTERESPFSENGQLWSDGTELVCDETAIVVRGGSDGRAPARDSADRGPFRYPNSQKIRMVGGYMSNYKQNSGLY